MAKPEERRGTPGVDKIIIDSKQCVGCGTSDKLLIHTHPHRHGQMVHEHPHQHDLEKGPATPDDEEHEHDHNA